MGQLNSFDLPDQNTDKSKIVVAEDTTKNVDMNTQKVDAFSASSLKENVQEEKTISSQEALEGQIEKSIESESSSDQKEDQREKRKPLFIKNRVREVHDASEMQPPYSNERNTEAFDVEMLADNVDKDFIDTPDFEIKSVVSKEKSFIPKNLQLPTEDDGNEVITVLGGRNDYNREDISVVTPVNAQEDVVHDNTKSEENKIDSAELKGNTEPCEEKTSKSSQQMSDQDNNSAEQKDAGSFYDKSLSDIAFDICKVGAVKKAVNFAADFFARARIAYIVKKFEKGKLIQSGNFKFLLQDRMLMAYKYSGMDMNLRIPAYVGNVPVVYLHPDFLSNGFFDDYRGRGIKNAFTSTDVQSLDLEQVSKIGEGLKSIVLPNTLKVIPRHVFVGCNNVKELVLPESIAYVDKDAFEYSKIETLYFNGPAPKTFWGSHLPKNVYVRAKYKDTFLREEEQNV